MMILVLEKSRQAEKESLTKLMAYLFGDHLNRSVVAHPTPCTFSSPCCLSSENPTCPCQVLGKSETQDPKKELAQNKLFVRAFREAVVSPRK